MVINEMNKILESGGNDVIICYKNRWVLLKEDKLSAKWVLILPYAMHTRFLIGMPDSHSYYFLIPCETF